MEQNAVSNPAEDARAHGDIVPSSGISGWVRSRASAIRPNPLRKLRSFDRWIDGTNTRFALFWGGLAASAVLFILFGADPVLDARQG